MTHNPGPAFLDSLGAEAGRKVTDFNAQNLANTIWAFGTLGKSNYGYSQPHMCYNAQYWECSKDKTQVRCNNNIYATGHTKVGGMFFHGTYAACLNLHSLKSPGYVHTDGHGGHDELNVDGPLCSTMQA